MAETKTVFTEDDIKSIARVLNDAEVNKYQDHWRIKVVNHQEKRQLSVEIYPHAALSEKKQGALIVVYANNSHLQLHCCRGFVVSEELGEITFVSDADKKLSGLVIEREAACSLYANADKELLSGDFTKLGVEVMLSGVALSLAEDILDNKSSE
jgi:hypothetical protein